MTTEFKLTPEEVQSALWKRLSGYLRDELAALREQNDAMTLNPMDTMAKRGEIRFAKQMLALADEAGQASRQDGSEDALATAIFPPQGGHVT